MLRGARNEGNSFDKLSFDLPLPHIHFFVLLLLHKENSQVFDNADIMI